MRKFIFTLIIFASTVSSYAGNNAEANTKDISASNAFSKKNASQYLIGKVLDNNTSEALAGATVLYNNRKFYTDLDGFFKIEKTTDGNDQILISMISYKDQPVKVEAALKDEFQVRLKQ